MKVSSFFSCFLFLSSCSSNKEINKEISVISKETIHSTVNSHYSELEECFKQAKWRNEKIAGKIALRWTIISSGSVENEAIVENKTGDKALAKCFLAKLKGWQFPYPTPKGTSAEVEYFPFTIK
jgi:hypothetical protein